MSLILEALRKSEAERRRGHMPDLHAELPPPATPRVAPKPAWPWLAGGAGVAALGIVAWLAMGPRAEGTAPARNALPPPVAARPAALPPVARLQPAPPPVERTSTAVVGTATPGSPSARVVTAVPAAPPADILPPPAVVATARPAPIPSPLPRPASPTPAPMASPSAALSLADLAPSERKALPPLKLSMHMWNDDAAQRFVILDGNRLGEGDRIGDAVVTAITRDGVLLDWNGRALKVPLR